MIPILKNPTRDAVPDYTILYYTILCYAILTIDAYAQKPMLRGQAYAQRRSACPVRMIGSKKCHGGDKNIVMEMLNRVELETASRCIGP